jgi:hypothetical protein
MDCAILATGVASLPPLREKGCWFPTRAFGYATQQYWAFIQALVDGLQAYDAQQEEGNDHAPTPLPAA